MELETQLELKLKALIKSEILDAFRNDKEDELTQKHFDMAEELLGKDFMVDDQLKPFFIEHFVRGMTSAGLVGEPAQFQASAEKCWLTFETNVALNLPKQLAVTAVKIAAFRDGSQTAQWYNYCKAQMVCK